MKILSSALLLLLTLIFLMSCESDPISIGEDVLPDSDKIELIQKNSYEGNWLQSSNSYYDTLTLENSTRLLLGREHGISSSFLNEWFVFLPDSIYNPMLKDSIEILSSWVEMVPNYKLGNENANYGFTVHQILSNWKTTGFDKSRLDDLEYDPNNAASNISRSDTLVRFDLDKNIAHDWVYDRKDQSDTTNHGIYLKPDESTDRIIGFPSANSRSFGSYMKLYIVLQKIGDSGFIDTVLSQNISSDVHVVEGHIPDYTENEILLHPGFAMRGKLTFDLSDIPEKSIINKADLTLFYDQNRSINGSPQSDTISVFGFENSLDDSISNKLYPTSIYRFNDTYTGDITRMIQGWVNGRDNNGMRLNLADDLKSASKIIIYGSKADDTALRPRLTITYTAIK